MTKEKFAEYESIRRSGATNMFDVKAVIELSKGKLNHEDVLDIMRNYNDYMQEYYIEKTKERE